MLFLSPLYSIQMTKQWLLSVTKFLTQRFVKMESSLSKPLFCSTLKNTEYPVEYGFKMEWSSLPGRSPLFTVAPRVIKKAGALSHSPSSSWRDINLECRIVREEEKEQ